MIAHSNVAPGLSPACRPQGRRYSEVEQCEILRLAQLALTSLFVGKTAAELEGDADRLGLPSAEKVNVTLRCGANLRGSMSARGSNLGWQVVHSVLQAAMDRRFGEPLTRWELPHTRLEVWIQIGSLEISPDARSGESPLLLGIEGVEIEGRGKSAYFKPSVAITSRKETARDLFQALCKKAGLEKDAWQAPDVNLRKTQWVCLSSANHTLSILPEISPSSRDPLPLDSWIAESASYLIRNQEVIGDPAYLYDPIADVVEPEPLNLVRAAGCVYALSQVLQSRNCPGLEESLGICATQMARSLLNRTVVITESDINRSSALEGGIPGSSPALRSNAQSFKPVCTAPGGRVVQEAKASALPKLGATTLLAAALSTGILHEKYAEEYGQLYRAIASVQKPDGCFITRFGSAEQRESEVNYFSGEALLVLVLEAERGNAEALERCRRAFAPYVLHFRQAPSSAFVGWHVDVWSRIALLTGESAYADFAFEQTDWLLQMQVIEHPDERWVGGFSDSGAAPRFSSIVFLEATARALALALKIEDVERSRKYAEAVRRGLQFCRRLRLEETNQSLLGNPPRCQGGIALSLLDRRVRCDAVQHFITLCLALQPVKALIT